MKARNKGKFPYWHLFECFLPHLTLPAEKFLVSSQSLCSRKSLQASSQGRCSTVLAWIHAISLTIARMIWRCSSHFIRNPLIRFQVQWDVYAWVVSSWCETTGHTCNIWSQNTREYFMSNAAVTIAWNISENVVIQRCLIKWCQFKSRSYNEDLVNFSKQR